MGISQIGWISPFIVLFSYLPVSENTLLCKREKEGRSLWRNIFFSSLSWTTPFFHLSKRGKRKLTKKKEKAIFYFRFTCFLGFICFFLSFTVAIFDTIRTFSLFSFYLFSHSYHRLLPADINTDDDLCRNKPTISDLRQQAQDRQQGLFLSSLLFIVGTSPCGISGWGPTPTCRLQEGVPSTPTILRLKFSPPTTWGDSTSSVSTLSTGLLLSERKRESSYLHRTISFFPTSLTHKISPLGIR